MYDYVPERVRERAEALRKELGKGISVRRIGDSYYAYECAGQLDKETGKLSALNSYLGKMLDDGTFIPVRHRSDRSDRAQRFALRELSGPVRAKAEEVIRERKGLRMMLDKGAVHFYDVSGAVPKYHGTVCADGAFRGPEELAAGIRANDAAEAYNDFNETDAKILTILSMNGRATVKFISSRIGLGEDATYSRIRQLEEEYGIKHHIEFDVEKLGLFSSYIVFVKFEGDLPTVKEMQEAVQNEPKIQFAAITKGEFDMVMCLFDADSGTASDTIWKLRSESALKSYTSDWYLSPISQNYGYIPFRDALFETILKENVWQKTKETPRPRHNQLLAREFSVMRELNKDGRANFSEIERKYGLSKGTAQYTYYRLKERGIIRRMTITMEKLPMMYLGILLLKDKKGDAIKSTNEEYLKEMMSNSKVSNKYALQGYVGTPTGRLLFMPVTANAELDKTLEFFSTRTKGIKATSLIVSDVLVGKICYRRFDNAYSWWCERLQEQHNHPKVEKARYD